MSHYCPRRDDNVRWMAAQKGGGTFYFDPETQVGSTPLRDEWVSRNHYGVDAGLPTCSYCGSLCPQDFIQALRDGREIHGTDKRYKAYVMLPNPNAGNPRIISAAKEPSKWGGEWVPVTNAVQADLKRDGWGSDVYKWALYAPDSGTSQAKFYFQHIAHPSPERAEFYDWYTEHPEVFYSGAPLGLHNEYIARHPDQMSEKEVQALTEFKDRNPDFSAP